MIRGVSDPGSEIELAAKATGEVVKALAGESGVLQPVREFATYLEARVHYRYYPKVIERALSATEKIRQSGLPRRAFSEVPDRLLAAILENGAMEDEPTMQERWENLLANALISGSAEVKKAFPNVLSELEPAEAARLDKFADETTSETLHTPSVSMYADVGSEGLDNLVRQGLLDYVRTLPHSPAPGAYLR
jgi:Abortive infection alpha